MKAIELARQLTELGQMGEAQTAYSLALGQEELMPEEEMECASFLFFSQVEDYQTPYRTFVSLFNRGLFQGEVLELLVQAFYVPNAEDLRKRYEANCKRLAQYPYLFRKDFPAFDDLPVLFFPFDDNGYLPLYSSENRFGDYVDFNCPVIDRYFFKDLKKPVLAKDVFSQYQLEYLNNTVRKSEWVGRENHIYLHYTDWAVFCAHLQCLDFKDLLKDEKFVFLVEDEVEQYPIDFQLRFGIDYSQYSVKPIGVQEVNRLIWHAQLSTHNGGDFFNEIFYGHPNLLVLDTIMLDETEEAIAKYQTLWRKKDRTEPVLRRLVKSGITHPTEKDILVAIFMEHEAANPALDPQSRIVPALFFQPHFPNIFYEAKQRAGTQDYVLSSKEYRAICDSPIFNRFPYIKTFLPMRRFTTSYAATIRFSVQTKKAGFVLHDVLTSRMLLRSYLATPGDRLYRDCVVVRFEDSKLNPKATFTALAEFLDIPYTESMEECSILETWGTVGFDAEPVYRTYDEYSNDADRALLEYLLRDAYAFYGYDFHYYKGEPVDEAWLEEKALGAVHLDTLIESIYADVLRYVPLEKTVDTPRMPEEEVRTKAHEKLKAIQKKRILWAKLLHLGSRFVAEDGRPLYMLPLLKPNPALLEQPLYH